MANILHVDQQSSKRGQKTLKVAVLAIVITITAITLFVLCGVMLGLLYIGAKQPADRMVLASQVCDKGIVAKYNVAFRESNGADKMKAVADELRKKPGYQQDATCRYILFNYFYRESDAKSMQVEYDAVASLAQKGLYPNPELQYVGGLDWMKAYIDQVKSGKPPEGGSAEGIG